MHKKSLIILGCAVMLTAGMAATVWASPLSRIPASFSVSMAMASSQEIGCHLSSPRSPTRFMGVLMRVGP